MTIVRRLLHLEARFGVVDTESDGWAGGRRDSNGGSTAESPRPPREPGPLEGWAPAGREGFGG